MTSVRCTECSSEVEDTAQFCDHCGAALSAVRSAQHRRRLFLGAAALASALIVGGAAWYFADPSVNADALHAAVQASIASGDGPGRDPICVANGLAYDQLPVNVQADNAETLSWMNTLVEAGLYQGPEESLSGGFFTEPIMVYQPMATLAQWGGARRLCVARAVRLEGVANLGRVESMRYRGKPYTGVSADVIWGLDDPAPWLANAGVGEVLARELPAWRNARWTSTGTGWRLTQRRHFFFVDKRWVTGETIDRIDPPPPKGTTAAALQP